MILADDAKSHMRAFLVLFMTLLLIGCGSERPSAPPLQEDTTVYQSQNEGFRFVAPDGWTQRARAEFPKGKMTKEHLLVEYKRLLSNRPASLEVSMVDVPESTALTDYIEKNVYGPEVWKRSGDMEKIEVNGSPAIRVAYVDRSGKSDMAKEIVVFRRGERIYLFAGVFPASDAKARKEVRQTVSSVVW